MWHQEHFPSTGCSRRRKQAYLSELETQVSRLRAENSALLMKRLTDINQKYNEASVDNRVLKADVETARAKVKMAKDGVKRVTGASPLFPPMSDVSSISKPFSSCLSELLACPKEPQMLHFPFMTIRAIFSQSTPPHEHSEGIINGGAKIG